MPLQATSGAASYDAFGGGVPVEPNYIESVFQTYLYTGNSSTQTITNGIDLSTKGGLVWTKTRSSANSHNLFDSTRALNQTLSSNTTQEQQTINNGNPLTFNTNGFSLPNSNDVNVSGTTYASWTFRKQPKFFDVVTYTGNGSAGRTLSHSLASQPGFILIKRTDGADPWLAFARLNGTDYSSLRLNTTAAGSSYTQSDIASSTVINVGYINQNIYSCNISGETYVAYLFAHNAGGFGLTGTDNVISCGSVTTPSSGITTVDLGYEPQWLLIKRSDGAQNWFITDNMQGFSQTFQSQLSPNTADAENTNTSPGLLLTSTGFSINASSYGASRPFIYIAIRRGPMKVPTSGTSVFSPNLSSSSGGTITTNFPVDLSLNSARDSSSHYSMDRLRGATTNYYNVLVTNTTAAEDIGTGAGLGFDNNTGFVNSWSGSSYVWWNFRRAPSFFDEVCYTGTGSGTTITHNLGVTPELVITKSRTNGALGWVVWTTNLTNTDYWIRLDSTMAQTNSPVGYGGTFSASNYTIANTGPYNALNGSGQTFVAYLFATCAGVSKVFSYTGNGSSQTINCGFTGGARWILIKRTDSTGDWYVWDSARGIVSGNDPHLSLNSTAAEVTTDDTIDTDSTGFVVNQVSATNVNVSSATYIGLAIA